ncbi:MAG: ABC transporter ATP-binding protein, partial [Cellulosilyticaceae bacterium]
MDENTLKSSKLKTLGRLLTYIKPYKWKTTGIIFLLLLIMGIGTLTPYLMKVCIDNFVTVGNVSGLFYIGALLVGITLFSMILSKIRIYSMSKITNTVLIDIRKEIFTHLQTLNFKFFDSRPVGKILSRVIGDVNALQNLLNNSIVNLIPNLFTITMVILMMFTLNFALSLVCILVLPILFAAMFIIEVKSNKLWARYRENRSEFIGYTHEAFSGMRVIQAFGKEKYIHNKFNHSLDSHGNSFLKAVKLQDYFWPMVDLCRGLGISTVLFSGFMLYSKDLASIGTIMAFIMYIEMLWQPIMNLSAFYNAFVTNLSAAERIFEVLDTTNDMLTDDPYVDLPTINGKIEFKNVTFSYDDDDKHALKNVSFTIHPGEKVALVGETGSGKTTITNLISKFYNPSSGKVLVDGIDIKTVETESLRS